MRKPLKFFGGIILGFILLIGLIILDVQWEPRITRTTNSIQPAPYAIILGASVTKNGQPSDALRDRLLTGVDLYQEKKVEKLLVTGDDGGYHINEVAVMQRFLLEAGVPADSIIVDNHGYRTYESCKRARQEVGIEKAVIVTQRFHLARAVYLCSHFGIESQGIAADRQTYVRIVYFWARDLVSSAKAWWDVNMHAPDSPVKY